MQAGVQQEGIPAETSREVSEPASGEQRLDGTSGSAVTGEHSATSTGGGATAGETPSVPASSGPATKVSSAEKAGSETLAPPETIALLLAGDAHRGKRLAAKCLACHRLDDRRKVGPGLKGVVGRRAGKMPDMKYSKALAEAQWIWDEPKLAEWVCNSKQAIRKLSGDDSATTKMPAQRICDPRDQSDLIAFLKSI
ncbi:MAG: hypothetical protein D6703_00830 [Zetaproteobacteria bacterium]|nr:MAG: hypothetical protein D6703_00830 [Zetaproteobacteria bacterium]